MSHPQAMAFTRMSILLQEASKVLDQNPARSKHYVEMAMQIQQRYKAKWGFELKQQFCKKCHQVLVLSKNAKKRVHLPYMTITCNECGFSHHLKMELGEK